MPRQYQHRVLFYGVLGALVFRGIFLALGVDPGKSIAVKRPGKRFATPLLAVMAGIEAADLIFAVDSVPAVLAVSATFSPFSECLRHSRPAGAVLPALRNVGEIPLPGQGPGVIFAERLRVDEKVFVLRYVQPGPVGLIDGTLSTLAPVFAAAVLAGSHAALLIGLATALGAGISMGLSEALSDDGKQTDRGTGVIRGLVTGGMTTLGGVFHALPFLISHRNTAIGVALFVVLLELIAISVVRKRFLAISLRNSFVQVTVGGILILAVGLLLGRA